MFCGRPLSYSTSLLNKMTSHLAILYSFAFLRKSASQVDMKRLFVETEKGLEGESGKPVAAARGTWMMGIFLMGCPCQEHCGTAQHVFCVTHMLD